MKRLCDEEGGGPLLELARQLLSLSEPPPEVDDSHREVRQALVGVAQRHGAPSLGRPAIAVGVLLVTAGAAAHGGVRAYRTWFAPAPPPVPVTEAQPPSKQPPTPRVKAHVESAPVTKAAESSPGREPLRVVVTSARATPSVRSPVTSSRPRPVVDDPSAPTAAPATPPSAGAEAALVHSAVKALRRDGDPEKAAALLDRYAAREPQGPLAEEALALRVEAAAARKDPEACAYARQYLARHPEGRYRQVADSTLKGRSCR